jgi:hypothetical protein
LWINDGDCLVFFSEETDQVDPKPMLRVHKKKLERARSAFMSNLLKYGEIMPEGSLSPTSSGASPTLPSANAQWPLTQTSLGNLNEYLAAAAEGNGRGTSDYPPPLTTSDRSHRSTASQSWSASEFDGHTVVEGTPGRQHGSIRIPPSIFEGGQAFLSAAPSDASDSSETRKEVEITHELWFRVPSHIKRPDIQRRHHMATRNYLALLHGYPIIGNDYYEMLTDLHNVIDTYYELNELSERWSTAQVMIQYLVSRQLDDVRNNLSTALGLLAWAEQPNVLWEAGYLEAFVHCVGMMSHSTIETKEYRNLSQITRHKLQKAYNEMQLKLIEAEERLERFQFEELWFVDGIQPEHPAQRSFDDFRHFLYSFYDRDYGRWPTQPNHQGRWLSRDLVQRMQIEFGGVYDFLVDRDIAFDASEERHTRKWEMVSQSRGGIYFDADKPGLPLTTMLVGFDSSQKYNHIPHPYPLLPSVNTPTTKGAKGTEAKAKNFFGKLMKSKENPVPDAKTQYQMALAFSSATNMNRLGVQFDGMLHISLLFLPNPLTRLCQTTNSSTNSPPTKKPRASPTSPPKTPASAVGSYSMGS